MVLEYIGHAGFIVKMKLGKRLLVDPWVTGNPVTEMSLNDVPTANYVFVTHGHSDHGVSDAIEICKRDGAKFIANVELAEYAREQGVRDIVGCNYGGMFSVDQLMVSGTPALHSTTKGIALGFVLKIEGKTLWFMGDTGLMYEFEYIGKKYKIDYLFAPIGSRFTMDIYDALWVVDKVSPKHVIPVHYNTFPEIQVDVNNFQDLIKQRTSSNVVVVKPGDILEI